MLHQSPELLLIEQRDAMSLLAQTFDLHQLQSAIAPGGLQWIRPPTDDDCRLRRGAAVDDGPGAPSGSGGIRSFRAQNAGERQMHALQRSQDPGPQRGGRVLQSVDQFVGVLVSFATLANAAVNDLL